MATSCGNKLILDTLVNRVVELYKKLMSATTGQDSVYIKAKETLTALLEEADLDARERANVLSQTVSGMVTGLSAQAMQHAVELAKDDRDAEYMLAKVCTDIDMQKAQIEKLAKETDLIEGELENKVVEGWLKQAQLYRDFGVKPDHLDLNKHLNVSSDYDNTYGTKVEELASARAARYVAYAGSWRSNGAVTPDVSATTGYLTSNTVADNNGLTYWQTRVAERQKQGFDDNMRQHVVNSSASMMSMLLSTEASGIDYDPMMAQWANAIGYLNGAEWVTVDGVANNGDWKYVVASKY